MIFGFTEGSIPKWLVSNNCAVSSPFYSILLALHSLSLNWANSFTTTTAFWALIPLENLMILSIHNPMITSFYFYSKCDTYLILISVSFRLVSFRHWFSIILTLLRCRPWSWTNRIFICSCTKWEEFLKNFGYD